MESVIQNRNIILDVNALCKSFGKNHVLRRFTLQVHEGENVVVVGKSGSGKSVLIKCIIGLMQADSGSIHLLGKDVSSISIAELDQIRARVGFLFQSNALYDSMTVRENLLFPLRRHWLKKDDTNEELLVHEALLNVGLEHTIDMMPSELSGGMRKRIALARTLILKPKLILYDEPTTGLDPITSREIIALMNTISKKYNSASVIISHDMNCIKMAADRVVMLIDGKCYAEGNFESLKAHPDPKVAAFFEGE